MSKLLLKGGTILVHDSEEHVDCVNSDLLVIGNKIAKIEPNIREDDARIIDCHDKIISPGFVDTHHHMWHTQFKGRHADQTVLEFFAHGNFRGRYYTPSDVFWGQLAGCQEAINNGTTTIMDHSHNNYTPDHSQLAVSASVTSGVRMIYGYAPVVRVKQFQPFQFEDEIFEDWVLQTLEKLAKEGPYGDGRVQIGFAFDLWFLGKGLTCKILSTAESYGIKHFTAHALAGGMFGPNTAFSVAKTYDVLANRHWVWSHFNGHTGEDYIVLKESNGMISSTPSTELSFAFGEPIPFNEDAIDIQKNTSLGVDCHSTQAGSIVQEMRMSLTYARGRRGERFMKAGKGPRRQITSVTQAFNLGTINGARGLGMADKIGSIAVGKLADLVVFDALSPGMICAAQSDPIAAIIQHSSPADIDMVVVDGRIRKLNGTLLPVEVDRRAHGTVGRDGMASWEEVARLVLASRHEILQRSEKVDFDNSVSKVIEMFAKPGGVVENLSTL